jgi:hypothetical protein
MDEIISNYAQARLTSSSNRKYVEDRIINPVNQFHYNKFRDMLIQLIGLINVEIFETHLNQIKHQTMVTTLEALRTKRNELAHSYLTGTVVRRLDAPSVTKANFLKVYDGLSDIETCLAAMRI